LEQARAGEVTALGQVLELYRNYLRLVARTLTGPALRLRTSPSDLVQETFLEAYRDFPRFVGRTEPELVAWLRQILVRTLADQVKFHQRKGRDHRREESLEEALSRSCAAAQEALAQLSGTPSEHAAQREQAVLLADAVEKLPPDYREVFILRTLEHVPFEEIAARMNRSPGAARMLWTRALEQLKRLLETDM
jgi:RNA polymerase sigma-70 factor (ECF subfamily)